MPDPRLRGLLEEALRKHDLKGLVGQLRGEGLEQVAIYVLLEELYRDLREQGREADEDEVGDALDYIWGYCSRGAMWFERGLTDEELRAYREVRDRPAEPA